METKYKFVSQLANYRFSDIVQTQAIPVEWFYLTADPDTSLENIVRAFTYDELTTFQRFAVSNPANFPGPKQYVVSSDEEALWGVVPDIGENHPQPVTLCKLPKIADSTDMSARDIILCDATGQTRHVYDLPFNVIGRIQGLPQSVASPEA